MELPYENVETPPDLHMAGSDTADIPEEDEENGSIRSEDPVPYEENEIVRVSIVLEGESTVEAGYDISNIAQKPATIAYRGSLEATQETITEKIEARIECDLDVVWNLTLAANIISANVPYGKIEEIKAVDGVKDVLIETRYIPAVVENDLPENSSMSTSSDMVGSVSAWMAGFTGAGSRIAVIDTGIDDDHQSFDEKAFEYSLAEQAKDHGMTVEEYEGALNLLDVEEIGSVLKQLNVYQKDPSLYAKELYRTEKIPFAYNYVDSGLTINHDSDTQGEHGSHVAGILGANDYIPGKSESGYDSAIDSVLMQGMAPDAQILVMKVFGIIGGAYDSDYFAAVEDALLLGCDAVNLSLGSVRAGWGNAGIYQEIMDSLQGSGTVMVVSAGNSGIWASNTNPGKDLLYAEDTNFQTSGDPGAFTGTLSVASVDNIGYTGNYVTVGDKVIFYTETADPANLPIREAAAGDWEYVYLDDIGTEEQFTKLANVFRDRIVLCNRGTTTFSQKATAAYSVGAKALLVVNNDSGTISMDLSEYQGTMPAVSITQTDGAYFKSGDAQKQNSEGLTYYTGRVNVAEGVIHDPGEIKRDHTYTLSDFSSWGIPGTLELKPEISAPGGNIYSVNGAISGGESYENMSGTSMAAPQISGMVALINQYIEQKNLVELTGLSRDALAISLLMSTAEPIKEEKNGGYYYSVLAQGSGLADIGAATGAGTCVIMGEDGKVKAELGDDPSRTGDYQYTFRLKSFEDTDLEYTLGTDIFTQALTDSEGVALLDTKTTPVLAKVTYSVDGVEYVPHPVKKADVDRDGDTDVDDAKALLDFIIGNRDGSDLNLPVGDIDQDSAYTTYDAYLLLSDMRTKEFVIKARDDVEITVYIHILGDLSAYVNGAYIEGFTHIEAVPTIEGVLGSEHTIPILGFYGSWSEASMFDQNSYVDSLYGNDTIPYVIPAESVFEDLETGRNIYRNNYMTYQDSENGTIYYHTGNPYGMEETRPVEKAALRSDERIMSFGFSVIRNAAVMAGVVIDADSGELLYCTDPVSYGDYNYCAYYDTSSSAWQNSALAMDFKMTLKEAGVKEGSRVKVGMVAIPEFYLTDAMISGAADANGVVITRKDLEEILPRLEHGAFLTTTLKVDDTAPTYIRALKDTGNGNLSVSFTDNEDIAYMGVLTRSGASVYADVLAPSKGEDGIVTYTFNVGDMQIGSQCMVVACDYAGNETAKIIEYKGQDPDYTGKMFAFIDGNGETDEAVGEFYHDLVMIDPETVDFSSGDNICEGKETVAHYEKEVLAATSIGDIVFFLTANEFKLYAAQVNNLESPVLVSDLKGQYKMSATPAPCELAFNPKDNKLYLLCGGSSSNYLWTIDPLTGEAKKAYQIDISKALSEGKPNVNAKKLVSMAIDDEGKFYVLTNYVKKTGSSDEAKTRLVSWTIDDLSSLGASAASPAKLELQMTNVVGEVVDSEGRNVSSAAGTLTWSATLRQLYFVSNATGPKKNTDGVLWELDSDTGKATPTHEDCRFQLPAHGLFVVSSKKFQMFDPSEEATGLILSADSIKLMPGGTEALTYDIGPWTLKDKTVSWSSQSDEIATVDDNGVVTAHKVGSTSIIAKSNASGQITAQCAVEVEKLPELAFSALTLGETPQWSDFTSLDDSWTDTPYKPEISVRKYYAGALFGDILYVHDGKNLYAVDADTLEETTVGSLSLPFSDAAELPVVGAATGNVAIFPHDSWLILLNPSDMDATNEGIGVYWGNIDKNGTDGEPVAVAYSKKDSTSAQDKIYVLTESGHLWLLTFLVRNGQVAVNSPTDKKLISGINLEGIGDVDGKSFASMYCDPTGEYLVLTSYLDGIDETPKIQIIDTKTSELLSTLPLGEKTDKAPVVAAYHYDRLTDVSLTLDRDEISFYEDQIVSVKAKLKLWTTSDKVNWRSDDESIASVTQDGVITGEGEGTTTITATAENKKADGSDAEATVTVNVVGKEKLTSNAFVNGQLSDGRWVRIPLSNPSAASDITITEGVVFSGGGMGSDSKIYGSAFNYEVDLLGKLFRFDTANSFERERGGQPSIFFTPVDMTQAPVLQETIRGNTYAFFGAPMFIPYDSDYPYTFQDGRGMYLLADFANGTVYGSHRLTDTPNASAIAFAGIANNSDLSLGYGEDFGSRSERFYVLNDGAISIVTWTPKLDIMGSPTYAVTGSSFAMLDKDYFTDDSRVTMDTVDLDGDGVIDGLAVGYGDDGLAELFYIDLKGVDATNKTAHVSYLGTISESTGITSLYHDGVAVADASASNREPISSTSVLEGDAAASAGVSDGESEMSGGISKGDAASEVLGEEPVSSGSVSGGDAVLAANVSGGDIAASTDISDGNAIADPGVSGENVPAVSTPGLLSPIGDAQELELSWEDISMSVERSTTANEETFIFVQPYRKESDKQEAGSLQSASHSSFPMAASESDEADIALRIKGKGAQTVSYAVTVNTVANEVRLDISSRAATNGLVNVNWDSAILNCEQTGTTDVIFLSANKISSNSATYAYASYNKAADGYVAKSFLFRYAEDLEESLNTILHLTIDEDGNLSSPGAPNRENPVTIDIPVVLISKYEASADGAWTQGSGSGLGFHTNGPLGSLLMVLVDDEVVDPSNYTIDENGKMILKQEFLSTLSVGHHILRFIFNDGTTTASFEVRENLFHSASVEKSPEQNKSEQPEQNGIAGQNNPSKQTGTPGRVGSSEQKEQPEQTDSPEQTGSPEQSGVQKDPEGSGKQGSSSGNPALESEGEELHCNFILLIIGSIVLASSILFSVIDKKRASGVNKDQSRGERR